MLIYHELIETWWQDLLCSFSYIILHQLHGVMLIQSVANDLPLFQA